MNILIGSKNPAKVEAVKAIFEEAHVSGISVPSDVSAQPFTDEETKQGAVNRARRCAENGTQIGIGLEGGVMLIGDTMYLCNWGALALPDGRIFTASGARIPLPEEIKTALEQGEELGDVMERFAHKKDVRSNEGAIGIFTKNRVSRKAMFEHVLILLRGQLEFSQEK
ncbi:DUF84 family protein [Aciduricibacillus chroicocephali]|uniref:inosine/xanthosine triphosphatase n=1 Tax=Aciduricibacillus chroicocephali TaxID=3054939 RepID=A0ABY9KTD4_9BACI|nr:DUF84 family protein [Bacillaceae bacterium 44XB]